MSTREIRLKQLGPVLQKMLLRPGMKSLELMKLLALRQDRFAQDAFQTEGGSNKKKWRKFSPKTLRTPKGTWKIRYGTDLRGRPPGSFKPFVLRPGVRRYSSNSKLLQASGLFRKSFQLMSLAKDRFKYGTNHQLAEKIMSGPQRQVLVFGAMQKTTFLNVARAFVDRNLKA